MSDPDQLSETLGERVGSEPVQWKSIGGGDIARAYRVELDDGRSVFVKTLPDAHDMFTAEAAGLRWLAEPRAIRIPEVLGVGTSKAPFLALQWTDRGRPRSDHDDLLGRGLAELHRCGAPGFGLDHDNWIGSLPQANGPRRDWPTFYRERRLQPLIERASSRGLLDAKARPTLERVCDRLEDLVGPPEAPARLHGDLWSGNAMVGPEGEPVLIDPAVYGGHREVDLAMMKLFGGFSSRVFEAYDEAHPLDPSWTDRVALYQLYPLLVHVNLFGGGYVGQTLRAARRYVG